VIVATVTAGSEQVADVAFAAIPVGHGRQTAAVIPTAQLDVRPQQGHLSLLAEYPQPAAEVAAGLP
jgi:hypothetical protein